MHNVTVILSICIHALSSQCPVQCKFESAIEPFSVLLNISACYVGQTREY